MYRLLAFSFLLFCSSLYAAPQHFIIDTNNSRIHLSWHAFSGILSWARLNGVTGDITLTPDIAIAIQANAS